MLQSIVMAVSAFFIVDSIMDILNNANDVVKSRLETIRNLNKVMDMNGDIMDLSFQERIIKPIVENMIRSVSMLLPVKEESQETLKVKLGQAGIKMNPKDYRAMNIIIIALLTGLGFFFGKSQPGPLESLKFAGLGLLTGYVYRRYSLEGKITARKKAIKSQLPEVMDILSVSVVAGLSFDQALGHVVERAQGPLIDEFAIARREITLGKIRKDALNQLAERCDVPSVKSFTSAVIQADELGISMQNVLNTQSQMIRESHKQEVEEKAAKIPVKILLPMVAFIFPVIFIILMGPSVPLIMESLGSM